jgi:transposase
LGYRLYFCVSKPSSGRRLHEAETGSRLTNGSCAMCLNSNHVVLSTMPNVLLATRPVYMDDNARPHRSRAVTAYLQSEAVTSVPWPAMSQDLNAIEHIWDMLGKWGQQLVARRLWCPACSHERYTTKPLLRLHRKGQFAGCSLLLSPFRQPPSSYKACVYG